MASVHLKAKAIRMKKFLQLSLIFCPCAAFMLEAHMQISEFGVVYNQTETYDPMTSDVISLIPGHLMKDIYLHGMTRIINEDLGIAVTKMVDDDVCRLEDLDLDLRPSRFILEVASLEARNITTDTSALRTVYLHAVDQGEWKGDRATLTDDMKILCRNLTIRKIRNEFVTKEEFKDMAGAGNRVKRRSMRISGCCCSYSLFRKLKRTRKVRDTAGKDEIVHRVVAHDEV